MTPDELTVETLLAGERPEPTAEFATGLDARAAEGFPREPRVKLPVRRFRLAPALAGATTVVVVTAIAVSASGVLDDEPVEDGTSGVKVKEMSAPPPESADEPGLTVEPQGGGVAKPAQGSPVQPGTEPRKVARAADLALSTAPEELREVADGVVDVTHRYDGFVASSNVSSGEGSSATAEFELMLPARDLQPALDELSELAHVSSLTESTDDITNRFTTGRERITELIEQRDRLRAKLAQAAPDEAAALRARLDQARAELAAIRSELADADARVRFTPVHVSIAADGAGPDTGWSIGDALDDALRVLEVALGVALIILSGLIPFAFLAGIVIVAVRAWRGWRRNRALDESPRGSGARS